MEVRLMKNIEEWLTNEKKRIDTLTAPEIFEQSLRASLNKDKKQPINPWIGVAIALVMVFLVGYNYNALAYYSKQLFGYDEIMSGTLKELNEQGMGQSIGKEIQLFDGTVVTIDGIISDANRMILYYTVKDENGLQDEGFDRFYPMKVSGFLTNSRAYGGTGMENEDQTEFKASMEFEPVSPFSRSLTVHYRQLTTNGEISLNTIKIPYDPNKAMEAKIKQKINETVSVDKGTITFGNITASPTMTMIEGKTNVANLDRSYYFQFEGVELLANGIPLEHLGGGTSSSIIGHTFELRYDALPANLESLQLVVKEFIGYLELDEMIEVKSVDYSQPINLLGKELWITNITSTSGNVEITIKTEADILLDGERISITTKSGEIPLQTTVNHNFEKNIDGEHAYERTLIFQTTEEPRLLTIKGLHYLKPYNIKIDIPLN